MDSKYPNPFDDPDLDGETAVDSHMGTGELIDLFHSLFSFAMNVKREELLAEKTAKWRVGSIIEAIKDVAANRGSEYHPLTFERTLSKVMAWLKKNGDLEPLKREEVEKPLNWWRHGAAVSLKAKKQGMLYGWILRTRTGGYTSALYCQRGQEWDIRPALKLREIEQVVDGPALPVPIMPMKTRMAFAKYPRPDEADFTDEQKGLDALRDRVKGDEDTDIVRGFMLDSAYAREVILWQRGVVIYLRGLPGGDENVAGYIQYNTWVHDGYPPRPIGWESYYEAPVPF